MQVPIPMLTRVIAQRTEEDTCILNGNDVLDDFKSQRWDTCTRVITVGMM